MPQMQIHSLNLLTYSPAHYHFTTAVPQSGGFDKNGCNYYARLHQLLTDAKNSNSLQVNKIHFGLFLQDMNKLLRRVCTITSAIFGKYLADLLCTETKHCDDLLMLTVIWPGSAGVSMCCHQGLHILFKHFD